MRVRGQDRIGAEETVTVPAGTFRAIPVRSIWANREGSHIETVWYARGVGKVRSEHSITGGRYPRYITLTLQRFRIAPRSR
jgi:hypothetical protein